MFLNRPRKKRKIPFSSRGEVGGVFRIFFPLLFYVKLPKNDSAPAPLTKGREKVRPSPRGEGAINGRFFFFVVRMGAFKRGLALCGKSLLLLSRLARPVVLFIIPPIASPLFFTPHDKKRREGSGGASPVFFCRLEISVSLRIECVGEEKKKNLFSSFPFNLKNYWVSIFGLLKTCARNTGGALKIAQVV